MNYNIQNEKVKKQYESYLELDERLSSSSVHTKIKDIRKYELATDFADFSKFNADAGLVFKEKYKSSNDLDYSTVWRTLKNIKEFFTWLSQQAKYRRYIKLTDVRVFNLSMKEEAIAKRKSYRPVPTIEQVSRVLGAMPQGTEIERRNRAILAMLVVSGARVSALMSFKLKHVDIDRECIIQDAKEVDTKFSKTIPTGFFPVDQIFYDEIKAWITYLRQDKAYGANDPIFPAILNEFDASTSTFRQEQLSRNHITSSTTIRSIMQKAFTAGGLDYFNPHSIRHMLVEIGQRLCTTPEEYKVYSQNLGHSSPLTTFVSYGEVPYQRQFDVMKMLRNN